MNAGQLLINELRTGIDTIDLIITKDLEKKESRQLQGAHWNDDPVLITNLANLVNSVKVIAQSAVKMSMLKTSIFSFDIMDSFCKENIPIVNNIVTSYMTFTSGFMADFIFESASVATRGVLSHFKDLISAVTEDKNEENVNMLAGMVVKISEEMDSIPKSNKVAYRRAIMQKCKIIIETIQEFEGYVDSSSLEHNDSNVDSAVNDMKKLEICDKNDANDSDDDNDEEDDDENFGVDYSPDDLKIVQPCLELMRFALDAMKASIKIITTVSEGVTSTASHRAINLTSDSGNSNASVYHPSDAIEIECQHWVAEIDLSTKTILDVLIDLGAELYDPTDNQEDLQKHYDQLHVDLDQLLVLLKRDQFFDHISAEMSVLVASLSSRMKDLPIHLYN